MNRRKASLVGRCERESPREASCSAVLGVSCVPVGLSVFTPRCSHDADYPGRMDRIDLHAHTSWSDGTCGVAETFQLARHVGLSTLALTDHDTVAGWQELPAAVAASGVAAVPGIEVSAQHEGRSVHVLALLVDRSEERRVGKECRSRWRP